MRYSVGQLVWIVSSFNDEKILPPAIIISAYEDIPRIIINDPVKNARWMEGEDFGSGNIYDIMYDGGIEVGVSEEWLRPFAQET